MSELPLVFEGSKEFIAAFESFQQLVKDLQSETAHQMEHGTLEHLIADQGNEILRRLFQGHLDQRAEQEIRYSTVVGEDKIDRPHCRKMCKRGLDTLFGQVDVHRKGYSARDVSSLFPMDGELNLPLDQYSDGLRYYVGEEASKNSFDDVVETIAKRTGSSIAKRQTQELVATLSQDFDEFYATHTFQDSEASDDLLVLTTDGKGIAMHTEDLREATKQEALRESSVKKARLSPGEKRNRKRMATVASVYSVPPHIRTPEEIMKVDDQEPAVRPKINHKRVWASIERDPAEVIADLFQEARGRDPTHQRDWVILIDGEPNQLKRIHRQMKINSIQATIILDFIHVLEYVWKAAHCFHKVGSDEAENWVRERALRLLEGQVSQVAAGMRRSATKQALSNKSRAAIDDCADYLLKYKKYMHYNEYLVQGFPIATGIIEGACRHLVKDRMDLTGCRWRLKTAEAVLQLRALRVSGDFDEYWAFHKKQELVYNHLQLYSEHKLPTE